MPDKVIIITISYRTRCFYVGVDIDKPGVPLEIDLTDIGEWNPKHHATLTTQRGRYGCCKRVGMAIFTGRNGYFENLG